MFDQGGPPGPEELHLRDLQEDVCLQAQPGKPHVAAQEQAAQALQVQYMQ